jgi:hypothetical protein
MPCLRSQPARRRRLPAVWNRFRQVHWLSGRREASGSRRHPRKNGTTFRADEESATRPVHRRTKSDPVFSCRTRPKILSDGAVSPMRPREFRHHPVLRSMPSHHVLPLPEMLASTAHHGPMREMRLRYAPLLDHPNCDCTGGAGERRKHEHGRISESSDQQHQLGRNGPLKPLGFSGNCVCQVHPRQIPKKLKATSLDEIVYPQGSQQ